MVESYRHQRCYRALERRACVSPERGMRVTRGGRCASHLTVERCSSLRRAVPIPRSWRRSIRSTRCSSRRSHAARPTCTSRSAARRPCACAASSRPIEGMRAVRRRDDPDAHLPDPHDRAAEAARARPAARLLVRRRRASPASAINVYSAARDVRRRLPRHPAQAEDARGARPARRPPRARRACRAASCSSRARPARASRRRSRR